MRLFEWFRENLKPKPKRPIDMLDPRLREIAVQVYGGENAVNVMLVRELALLRRR